MAELITTINAVPVTAKAGAGVSFTRGLRGVLDSSGTYTLAGVGEHGQLVADTPTEAAAGYFLGCALAGGTTIPAVTSESVVIGEVAYTAASGKFSKTSTSAVRVGMWVQGATADGALGIIFLD